MSAHPVGPIELVDGHYPSIKEIKGLSFSLTIVVQANDLSFKDEFDRLDDAARIVKTWNEYDDLLAALQQSFDFPPSFFKGRADDEIVTITVTGRHLNLVRAALAKAGAA